MDELIQKMTENYIVRTLPSNIRAKDDGGISGEATVFNQYSNDLGGFREIIEATAFENTEMGDVVALFNHDRNFVLGRTKSGTLSLRIESSGLMYDVSPQVTTQGKDIERMVKRGDIMQSSFGFDLLQDGSSWSYDDEGNVVHRIKNIARLWDVSPVTWPAYSGTSARSLTRSLQEARDAFQKAQNEKEGAHQLEAMAEAQRKLEKAQRERHLRLRELSFV